jgi:hypothetical protein
MFLWKRYTHLCCWIPISVPSQSTSVTHRVFPFSVSVDWKDLVHWTQDTKIFFTTLKTETNNLKPLFLWQDENFSVPFFSNAIIEVWELTNESQFAKMRSTFRQWKVILLEFKLAKTFLNVLLCSRPVKYQCSPFPKGWSSLFEFIMVLGHAVKGVAKKHQGVSTKWRKCHLVLQPETNAKLIWTWAWRHQLHQNPLVVADLGYPG